MLANSIIEVKDKKLSLYPSDYEAYVYRVRLDALEEEERELKYQENNKEAVNKDNNSNSNEEKNSYEERKKMRNKLSKCEALLKKHEQQIEDYKKEEAEILKFFETSSGYDDEKSRRLLEVKKLIEDTENEWLLTNEEIDSIKSAL